MAPALTEAGQSQNFALNSSNCSPIGLRNGGNVGGGTVEGIGSPRVRKIEGPGAVSDIPEGYVSCKRSLIGAGVDGNGVDEAAFENLTTLAIASELFKVNKAAISEGSHVVNGHLADNICGESLNGGGNFGQYWDTTGMSTNLPDDTGGDADGSEAAEPLPMPTDDLGQNVRDLLEVIQGLEKTEGANVQDPFGSDRKSTVSPHDHVRANDGSIFSTGNHDGASAFDLPNGPVDGIYPDTDLECNLQGVDMMPMCVVEIPGGSSGNGMGNSAGALLDTSSLGVGGNTGGLLDGGGLDSQLALDSHLAEDGLCVSREALSGEKKCEVQKRQAEVERKIERLLRRLGKLQARRMGRHAAEELRVVVEHAKQSLSNMAGNHGKVSIVGSRRNEYYDSSFGSSEAGKRPPFLSSYVQDASLDPAAGLRIGRPNSSLGSSGDVEGPGESVVKSEDVRNLPTATLESLAQRLDKSGAGKLTKRYFGSGSPRARLEEAVEGAVAAAEVGSSTSRAEEARRRRRRRRFGDWGEDDEENDELGRKKVQTGLDLDAGDEKRRRRRLEEERVEVKRDGDVKVVVVRRANWGCEVGSEEAEVDEAFGKLGAQFRVVEKGIDSDATASSSGAESADETVSGYSASATGTLSIGRRAAWKWARDRAWIGSRWTWLQAQISDLEYRIRQQNEIHRQIRATKGPLVFAKPAEQVHQSPQTVVVNGFHHTEMGKNVEGCAGEGDTCCRVRPLRFLPRKRRLLRASDPGGVGGDGGKRERGSCVSPPSKAAEVLCTGCHHTALSVPPCVLCSAPRQGQSAPSLSAPRAPPPCSLPVPERVARIDPSFHPILSFPRDISADIHMGAIMKTQSWQQEVLSEKGKPSLANLAHSSTSAGRSGGSTAGISRRRRGGAIGGARRGRRPTLSGGMLPEELEEENSAPGCELNPGARGGASLSSRRRNYAGFRMKKVTPNALTSKLHHKLTKGRRGRGRVGRNHCDPLNRHNQKRLKAAMALQSVCDEADEQLRMEMGLSSHGTFSAPGTAPSSPFPPASPASPGSTSPPHHSSASSSSSTSSASHPHHHHSPYSPLSSSIAPGSYSIGTGGDRKASMLHDLLSRRKRENSYDIDNIVIPYSVAASTRVEKLPYKEILTPKWRVVEPFPPKKLEAGDNGIVRRSSHESEEEDVSAEAVAERHERCEQEERKRFLRLLRRPHGANSGSGDAKSQGGGRGGRRGRADSRAESSGQNTPDPLSPDHHSACPSPLPLSAANSPPPTPLPLPPLPEESATTSQDATDVTAAPSSSKNPAENATQASSSSSSSKSLESQSQSEPAVSVTAKSQTSSETAVPSQAKVSEGRLSTTELSASPFKTQVSKLNNSVSKGSKGWNEGPVSARRRTVSSSLLHPHGGSGRERSTTPIDPYDEYPQPKPFEPYVFPLSDEFYKQLLAKMPAGHHFPPVCPSLSSPHPSQPSSKASSTNGDGPAEATQPPPSVSSSKNGNSMEQIPSAPRSPCSETTESVLEEDDRGEDDLGQGDMGDNDDPDWTLRDEVRGRASKR